MVRGVWARVTCGVGTSRVIREYARTVWSCLGESADGRLRKWEQPRRCWRLGGVSAGGSEQAQLARAPAAAADNRNVQLECWCSYRPSRWPGRCAKGSNGNRGSAAGGVRRRSDSTALITPGFRAAVPDQRCVRSSAPAGSHWAHGDGCSASEGNSSKPAAAQSLCQLQTGAAQGARSSVTWRQQQCYSCCSYSSLRLRVLQ